MPKAKNGDISIYYEVVGSGPPLILHHGLGGWGGAWREPDYVGALENDYKLILMDARGHGKSDKPHDPESYHMENRAGDVTAVLDDLGISKTHYLGYSYGGRIGFEVAKCAPERVLSLIIGGAGAKGRNPDTPNPTRQLLEAGPEAAVAMFEQAGPISDEFKAGLRANDYQALLAIIDSPSLDLEGDMPKMTMPFLLYAGENDPAFGAMQEAGKMLPHATFISLPGIDHLRGLMEINLVLPHIKKFLAQVR